MIATILLVLAAWLVIASAAAYAFITYHLRAEQREADADFDRELHDLLTGT